jgi:hypothetical protein
MRILSNSIGHDDRFFWWKLDIFDKSSGAGFLSSIDGRRGPLGLRGEGLNAEGTGRAETGGLDAVATGGGGLTKLRESSEGGSREAGPRDSRVCCGGVEVSSGAKEDISAERSRGASGCIAGTCGETEVAARVSGCFAWDVAGIFRLAPGPRVGGLIWGQSPNGLGEGGDCRWLSWRCGLRVGCFVMTD